MAKNSCQKVPKSDFQSQFSTSKTIRIFLKKISLKNINLGAHFLFLLILCSIKIERLLFPKFLKNLAFFWQGHRVDHVAELPLVISDKIQSYTKTKEAHIFLKKSKAFQDVDQVYKSKRFRAGKGKMRDRKRIMKKGPLVIFDQDQVIWPTSYPCQFFRT